MHYSRCGFFVFVFCFLTPKMFHLSVEAIQLYMMRQAGPLKNLCLWDVGVGKGRGDVGGCCRSRGPVGVEVLLWIPLRVCCWHCRRWQAAYWISSSVMSKVGEVFVAAVVLCFHSVDRWVYSLLHNWKPSQVPFICWDGNARAAGEPMSCFRMFVWLLSVTLLSGSLVDGAQSSAFRLFSETVQVPEMVSCLLDKGFSLAVHLLCALRHDPSLKGPWTFCFFPLLCQNRVFHWQRLSDLVEKWGTTPFFIII